MEELCNKQENSRFYNDIQSAIHIAKNSTFHLSTKHIQLKYHFIRYVLEDELLKLEKIHTSHHPIYMVKKVVTRKSCSCLVLFGIQA